MVDRVKVAAYLTTDRPHVLRQAISGWPAPALSESGVRADRLTGVIAKSPLGWMKLVTLKGTGACDIRPSFHREARVASTITPSMYAKASPMHRRGPPPKGKYE